MTFTSSFVIHSSICSNTPGLGATAISVLIRSTGTNFTEDSSLLSDIDFNSPSSSFDKSVGRLFFTSNSRTRCFASTSLSNNAIISIVRRMLRRLSITSSRLAG